MAILISVSGDVARSDWFGFWAQPYEVDAALQDIFAKAWGPNRLSLEYPGDNFVGGTATTLSGSAQIAFRLLPGDKVEIPFEKHEWRANRATGDFLEDQKYANSFLRFEAKAPSNDLEQVCTDFMNALYVALGELPGPKVWPGHPLAALFRVGSSPYEVDRAIEVFKANSAEPLYGTRKAAALEKKLENFGSPDHNFIENLMNVWRFNGSLTDIDSPVSVFFIQGSAEENVRRFDDLISDPDVSMPLTKLSSVTRQFIYARTSTIWPADTIGLRADTVLNIPFRVIDLGPTTSAVIFDTDPWATLDGEPQSRYAYPYLFKLREARLVALKVMTYVGVKQVVPTEKGMLVPIYVPMKGDSVNLEHQTELNLSGTYQIRSAINDHEQALAALEADLLESLAQGARVDADLALQANVTCHDDIIRYFPEGVIRSALEAPGRSATDEGLTKGLEPDE